MPRNALANFGPFLYHKTGGNSLLKLEGAVLIGMCNVLMTATTNFNKLVPPFLQYKNGPNLLEAMLRIQTFFQKLCLG